MVELFWLLLLSFSAKNFFDNIHHVVCECTGAGADVDDAVFFVDALSLYPLSVPFHRDK